MPHPPPGTPALPAPAANSTTSRKRAVSDGFVAGLPVAFEGAGGPDIMVWPRAGVCSLRGEKETQEDRAVGGFPVGSLGTYYAVYDGHGGAECADALTQHLHLSVACSLASGAAAYRPPLPPPPGLPDVTLESLHRLDDAIRACDADMAAVRRAVVKAPSPASRAGLLADLDATLMTLTAQREAAAAALAARRLCNTAFEGALVRALELGFRRSDAAFLAQARRFGLEAGSTAVACLVHGPPADPRLVVANVGDSRAVLCRGGRAVALSDDHKPNRRDEARRVAEAGGTVVELYGVWRIVTRTAHTESGNSSRSSVAYRYLGVARAFGDLAFKEPLALVSATPEVRVEPLGVGDDAVILACDGVWDVLTNQQAVDVVLPHLADPPAAAEALARAALAAGSTDNVTATVIVFPWAQLRPAQAAKVAAAAAIAAAIEAAAIARLAEDINTLY